MVTLVTSSLKEELLSLPINLILLLHQADYDRVWKQRKNLLEKTYLHVIGTESDPWMKIEHLVHFTKLNPFENRHFVWVDDYHPALKEIIFRIPDKIRFPIHTMKTPSASSSLIILSGEVTNLNQVCNSLLLKRDRSLSVALYELSQTMHEFFDPYLCGNEDPMRDYFSPELNLEIIEIATKEIPEVSFRILETFREAGRKSHPLTQFRYYYELIRIGYQLGYSSKVSDMAESVINLMSERFLAVGEYPFIARLKKESRQAH